MQVTRLRVYPVKSFGGNDVGSARVLPWGLEDDRRWALVDPDGQPVTAREANTLLAITAAVHADGALLLTDGGGTGERLQVCVPTDAVPVAVGHDGQGTALPAGDEAGEWLSGLVGRPVRLVWQPDPRARAVHPARGGLPGDRVSLADVGPLLLTNESSLAQLDEWTDASTPPLDMVRFRPNVVIDGDPREPFAEDTWPYVRLGDVRFRVSGVCDRCVMTTIDPASLARGKEPIRTLAKHRKWNGHTWFGVWLVPDLARSSAHAIISVGDAVLAG